MKKKNNFYSDKVVYKPWGNEHVVYSDSNRIAITFLKINHRHKTSLHCHPNKKTGFIILSGKALIQVGIYKENKKYCGPLSRRTRNENQLYGNDDGKLCDAAMQKDLFVGFTSNVEVLHLEQNVDEGYVKWKHQNIQGNIDDKGYWD